MPAHKNMTRQKSIAKSHPLRSEPAPLCANCERRSHGVFCNLEPSLLRALGGRKAFTLYRQGQIIFHEGNPSLACFCVQSGRVKLFLTDSNGKQQIVGVASRSSL